LQFSLQAARPETFGYTIISIETNEGFKIANTAFGNTCILHTGVHPIPASRVFISLCMQKFLLQDTAIPNEMQKEASLLVV
jgi:hypothetical protein